jgi:cytochrome P450
MNPPVTPVIGRSPPGPRGLPIFGSIPALSGDAFRVMLDWHRRYGDIVAYRLGPWPFFMLSHPALAEEVLIDGQDLFVKMYDVTKPVGVSLVLGQGLVTSRGELWKRQRRLMQPMFHRSRVAGFGGEIAAAGLAVAERWRALGPDQPVDVAYEMMRATLEVITRTMFSTSVMDRLAELSPALLTVMRYTAESMRNPFVPPLWIPTPGNRAFRRDMAYIDALIHGLIRARRDSGVRHDDLLDKLIHAEDPDTGQAMDERQIRDETLTIFIAGHETTAVALSWAWYLLAGHPEARDRLHAELDRVLRGRAPMVDDLPRLAYTKAVLDEALRLYPPALGVIRKAVRDTELGGYRVAANSLVFVNIGNVHRHAAFWEESEAFRPERFLESQPAPAHRLAYMPFGAGPRVCLGNHLALTEGVLLLATLAQRFRLDLLPGHRLATEITVTLRPKGGLPMRISPR